MNDIHRRLDSESCKNELAFSLPLFFFACTRFYLSCSCYVSHLFPRLPLFSQVELKKNNVLEKEISCYEGTCTMIHSYFHIHRTHLNSQWLFLHQDASLNTDKSNKMYYALPISEQNYSLCLPSTLLIL